MNPLSQATMPPLDHQASRYTGFTRRHWEHIADQMLLTARRFASPGRARILFPGPPGGYGSDIDGLEGFARSFMAAAFRLTGSGGNDPHDLAAWYASGIAAGTDPKHPHRWIRPDEHDQAKVEAAAIALGLSMTRSLIWDRLDTRVQTNLVDWLSTVIGAEYPPINWVWFRIVVEQFLRSVGGPWSSEDLAADLTRHDTFVRADGWYSDGPQRAYDHYAGWALHLYPILWLEMAGPEDEYAAPRRTAYLAHLDRFLQDAVRLLGRDGSPLIQGRSLIYRFAAAAPFWAGALSGSQTLAPGTIRRAASGMLKHFIDAGAFEPSGVLTLGWHGEWRKLAQSYSGTGSPYWASKGLLGLALPAEHPVWTSREEPLPIDETDIGTVATAPGWLISGTTSDGIVRVINHGTDHATPGDLVADPPLYARLGYSTATSPVLEPLLEPSPLDQSVVLLDAAGRPSHRTGFRTICCESLDQTGTLLGASVSRAHWVDPDPEGERHGSGLTGTVTTGPEITVVSVVRGGWEVRLVRVEPDTTDVIGTLRLGGWPISGQHPMATAASTVTSAGLTSRCLDLTGLPEAGIHDDLDATPLGRTTRTPWVATATHAEPGRWHIAALYLGQATRSDPIPPRIQQHRPNGPLSIRWPSGSDTEIDMSAVVDTAQPRPYEGHRKHS
ncbi:DUF2264 domain-containing protein [Enemella evansiae]|nr:DUF2264 domain-containing protein [Enemella evansiae]